MMQYYAEVEGRKDRKYNSIQEKGEAVDEVEVEVEVEAEAEAEEEEEEEEEDGKRCTG